MSTTVKAGIISAVLFIAVILAFVFLRDGKPKVVDRDSDRTADVRGVEGAARTVAPRADPLSPPPQRGEVELTMEVLEKGRGRRLPGSHVMVLSAMEGDRTSSRTVWESERDGQGLFRTMLEPGKYVVHAQCPRYKGERRSLTLIEGSPQTLVFELERGNSISGRVLTRAGEPIGGSRVQALEDLSRPDDDLEALLLRFIEIQDFSGKVIAEDVSASDGSYQLDGLDLKYYTVRAVASGYAPGEAAQVPAPRDRVDIVLDRGADLTGTVTDPSGIPVAEAKVHAYPEIESQNVFDVIMAKARPPLDSASSDGSGAFVFQTLGPGVYNFLVTARGFQQGSFMKVKVSEGMQPLSFTLDPGLTIRGIVRGPGEEPLEGARVRATLMGGGGTRQNQPNISFDDGSVYTDAEGAFTFDTLEEGKYMLLCWHRDYETAQRKDVRPSGEEVILRLGGGGRAHGLVIDAVTGKPIPGASVSASDVADLPKVDIAKEDGSYVLSGLRVSNRPVSLTVAANGYARLKAEIKPQENVDLEQSFELQPTASVAGRIVSSSGDPLPGVRVMAKRAQATTGIEPTIDSDITDVEGRYRLSKVEAGDGTFVVAKRSEFLDERSGVFSIEPLETLELPDMTLRLGGQIGGTVLSPDGQPVSGCLITILREGDTELDGKLNPTGSTNTKGEYVIPGLRSGTVSLVVKPVHFLEKRVDGVLVQEGAHNKVDIQLERGNSIGGRVVDARSEPIRGAEVLVRDFSRGVKELRTFSEADGRFVMDQIPGNAAVEIVVSHESYGSWTDQKVAVGTMDLEVVLQGLSSLRGSVIGADGTQIESFAIQPQLAAAGTDVRKPLRSETYNSQEGFFEYKGLQAGVYTVQVRAMGYAATTIDNVQVPEGETVDLGVVELNLGGLVTGTVLDAMTQRAVPNARVQIVQGASRFVASAVARASGGSNNPIQFTDGSGQFAFSGLKGGNLTLRVTHQDYVSRELPNVNPDAASTSQGLVVSLETGGEILGTVFDKNGRPRSDMPVYLISDSPARNHTAKTDRQGQFHFSGVAAGAYTVKAHQFGVPGESVTEQAEQAVQLANGARQQVVLQLD